MNSPKGKHFEVSFKIFIPTGSLWLSNPNEDNVLWGIKAEVEKAFVKDDVVFYSFGSQET